MLGTGKNKKHLFSLHHTYLDMLYDRIEQEQKIQQNHLTQLHLILMQFSCKPQRSTTYRTWK